MVGLSILGLHRERALHVVLPFALLLDNPGLIASQQKTARNPGNMKADLLKENSNVFFKNIIVVATDKGSFSF